MATGKDSSVCLGECDRPVTNYHKTAVGCARCGGWTHADCAGIPVTMQNRPLLKHENLVYLCDGCLRATQVWWARPEPARSDCGVQTDEVRVQDVEVQMDGVGPEDGGVEVLMDMGRPEDSRVESREVGVQMDGVGLEDGGVENRGVEVQVDGTRPQDSGVDSGAENRGVEVQVDETRPQDSGAGNGGVEVSPQGSGVVSREVVVRTDRCAGCTCERKVTSVRTQRRGPQVRKAVRRMPPIRVIGDSMVKKVERQVGCSVEGSGVDSLSGAKIGEVRRKVEEVASDMKDGLLIIQGGGNDLESVGTEDTVREVVEAVRAVEGKGMSVAVVGIMRRPREGERYERLRRRTNGRIQEEVLKLKVEWLKSKKGNVSFLDLDDELREGRDFAVDGVHLNDSGNYRMGRKFREWMAARSLECVSV